MMGFTRKGTARRLGGWRPMVEVLEGRQLLSLGAQLPGTVNTTTRLPQFDSDTATNPSGTSVVVWTSTGDIWAQILNSSGAKVGSEIRVSGSVLDEDHAKVAIDPSGRFEVVWTRSESRSNTNVEARRFAANGKPLGQPFVVAGTAAPEEEPDVATGLAGNFVVSYTRGDILDNRDVVAKLYGPTGGLLKVVNVATSSNMDEAASSVAMRRDGRFDVAWQQESNTSGHDVFLNRYDANVGFVGTTAISTTATNDQTPSVAIDNAGDAVVAWQQDRNITAVRVSPGGVRVARITVASSPGFQVSYSPSVAIRPGGGFVVCYQVFFETPAHARVAEVSASNEVTTFDLDSFTLGATVGIDQRGDYLVSYASDLGFPVDVPFGTGKPAGFGGDIHARIGHLSS